MGWHWIPGRKGKHDHEAGSSSGRHSRSSSTPTPTVPHLAAAGRSLHAAVREGGDLQAILGDAHAVAVDGCAPPQ